jgi:hypothetical protein
MQELEERSEEVIENKGSVILDKKSSCSRRYGTWAAMRATCPDLSETAATEEAGRMPARPGRMAGDGAARMMGGEKQESVGVGRWE